MTLKEKLQAQRSRFEAKAPAEVLAIMHNATETLFHSALATKAIQVGSRAPEFSLSDAQGQPVSLGRLTAQGPVVLNFYRGIW